MRVTIFLIVISFSLYSCHKPETQTASPNAKRYQIKGKIVSVDKTAKKAKIDHQKIEGFMDAMTMEFPVHADWALDDLTPGAELTGELVVDSSAKDPFWIENITIVAAAEPGQAYPPINESFAQIGQEVPDFSLTNQDGKRISLSDFRGKALAITFIYAKCPLPDYCIRMSTHFSDIANQLHGNNELRDKIRLLSISFDPSNDTPERLKSYGLGYMGNGSKPDFTVWQLAVGNDVDVRKIADFFGLRYEVDPSDKTLINHSLRTAVIGPDGKVIKIFAGNEWTPGELLKELQSATGEAQK
ncbi:MAG: SCO family protein [Pyrinomonadaceae bacterium]